MKAFYDHKPPVLEAVGNGSYLYRWDITNEELQWQCQEVTVWMPLTSNKITEAVISELWDTNYEQKLINEYNAAALGIYDESTLQEKINTYKQFLVDRYIIKNQIDIDCKNFGIHE